MELQPTAQTTPSPTARSKISTPSANALTASQSTLVNAFPGQGPQQLLSHEPSSGTHDKASRVSKHCRGLSSPTFVRGKIYLEGIGLGFPPGLTGPHINDKTRPLASECGVCPGPSPGRGGCSPREEHHNRNPRGAQGNTRTRLPRQTTTSHSDTHSQTDRQELDIPTERHTETRNRSSPTRSPDLPDGMQIPSHALGPGRNTSDGAESGMSYLHQSHDAGITEISYCPGCLR